MERNPPTWWRHASGGKAHFGQMHQQTWCLRFPLSRAWEAIPDVPEAQRCKWCLKKRDIIETWKKKTQDLTYPVSRSRHDHRES